MSRKSLTFSLFLSAIFVCSEFSFAQFLGRPFALHCATVFDPINVPGFTASNPVYLTRDLLDWDRDYGMKFFLDSDPMWKNPQYLKQFHDFATPQLTTYHNHANDLLKEFAERMVRLGGGAIAKLTSSGTQANNIMIQAAKNRYQVLNPKATNPELIIFSGPYGGSFGESAQLKSKGLVIFPERYATGVPEAIFHDEQLTRYEKEALQKIKALISTRQVAGIFFEPFAINAGGAQYRPAFLRALRKLADKTETPILADEILSGGGRTGRFWSYQHVEGFYPDLVTFGKGLIVAGVFVPENGKPKPSWTDPDFERKTALTNYFYGGPAETMMAHPVALLQAIQILKVIENRDIMNHIQVINDHLKNILPSAYRYSSGGFNVFGTVITNGNFINLPLQIELKRALNRYNLPYTITADQIDAILGRKPFIFEKTE